MTFLHHAAEIAASPYRSGVRWSGMSDELDLRPTAQQVAADREADAARRATLVASPTGQFLAAIRELEAQGVPMGDVWAAWSRADGDARSCAVTIAAALGAERSYPAARKALRALDEMLQARAA